MRASRTAPAVAIVALAVAALSGCSVVNAFAPNVTSNIFASHADLTKAATVPFGSPKWIPDDATIIRVDYRDDGSAAILTFTSKTHFAAGTCTAAAPVPKPPIQDSWWPVDGLPKTAVSCPGGWSAFALADQVYAAKGKPSS